MPTRFVTVLFSPVEMQIAEGMCRNSMANKSWARVLSASASIAINRVNYAYLMSIIQISRHVRPNSS